jgi:hypothetical protein
LARGNVWRVDQKTTRVERQLRPKTRGPAHTHQPPDMREQHISHTLDHVVVVLLGLVVPDSPGELDGRSKLRCAVKRDRRGLTWRQRWSNISVQSSERPKSQSSQTCRRRGRRSRGGALHATTLPPRGSVSATHVDALEHLDVARLFELLDRPPKRGLV